MTDPPAFEWPQRIVAPREAASLLGLPASTLRAYAVTFNRFLSDVARSDPALSGRTHHHRRYAPEDLEVLLQAKDLLASGYSFELAVSALIQRGVSDRGEERVPVPTLNRPTIRRRRGPSRRDSKVEPMVEAAGAASSLDAAPAATEPTDSPLLKEIHQRAGEMERHLGELLEGLDRLERDRAEPSDNPIPAILDGIDFIRGRLDTMQRRLDAIGAALEDVVVSTARMKAELVEIQAVQAEALKQKRLGGFFGLFRRKPPE